MALSDFLVAYDYGMGGVWAFARATSAEEVTRTFPELAVVNVRPDWMTAEVEDEMRLNRSFAVADPDTYPEWVQTLIAERNIP